MDVGGAVRPLTRARTLEKEGGNVVTIRINSRIYVERPLTDGFR
jgi:hypothetical protein